MKYSHPPVVATWLLKHFGRNPNNEAVIGDLVEHYQQGRSRLWYWRQVFIAIMTAQPRFYLAVIILGSVLAGGSLALQTYDSLAEFGAITLTGNTVAILLVRVLGPLGAALIIATSAGKIVSEINSVPIGQKTKRLIVRRTAAVLPTLLIVAVIITISAMAGGLLVISAAPRMQWQTYLTAIWNALHYADLLAFSSRIVVFGAMIGVTGCYFGIRQIRKGDAQNFRLAARRAVLSASILILASNLVLSRLFD
jgi:phospholipid/cholesterol/gamma-HCH transport system permease protein